MYMEEDFSDESNVHKYQRVDRIIYQIKQLNFISLNIIGRRNWEVVDDEKKTLDEPPEGAGVVGETGGGGDRGRASSWLLAKLKDESLVSNKIATNHPNLPYKKAFSFFFSYLFNTNIKSQN